MKNLYEYLSAKKIATNYNSEFDNITCYCTSEAMLSLLQGLNYNDDGFLYHAELTANCTWLLTRD